MVGVTSQFQANVRIRIGPEILTGLVDIVAGWGRLLPTVETIRLIIARLILLHGLPARRLRQRRRSDDGGERGRHNK